MTANIKTKVGGGHPELDEGLEDAAQTEDCMQLSLSLLLESMRWLASPMFL